MVRRIIISYSKEFKKIEQKIISIEEFIDNIDDDNDIFDDMTSNFEDLTYWNSENNLDKKQIKDVKSTINKILLDLKNKGFKKRELSDEDNKSKTIPNWMWGHKEKRKLFSYPEKLPNLERTNILMYHLNNLLNIFEEYNDEYYCCLD